ncbi:YPD1 [Candida pseudojiufengensis]|uniref:YPD1 n=1 Tax=Candida pseudojiufengensis TaxID=497109 RepID=UPI002225638B|nr:YPD1 [Candida pseudojiufengensis]KAI5963818.1 YPD1 [Candida pseudojiufengensis]
MSSSIDSKTKLKNSGLIDWSVFQEILQMDEDEEGFSKQLVETFVSQVEETFEKIEKFINAANLDDLSKEGHFLKGSAAALGLTSISEQCERIQNYGHKNNFDNFKPIDLNTKKIEGDETKTKDSKDSKDSTITTTTTKSEKEEINGKVVEDSKITTSSKTSKIPDTKKPQETTTPETSKDETNDEFWILAIEDALTKAKDGFYKTKEALDEFYDE